MKIDLCIGKIAGQYFIDKKVQVIGEEACTANSVAKNRNVFFF